MRRPRKRRGMTLIEILAALALTGLTLLGAILLLDQLSDSSGRIARNGRAIAARENGARVLDQLLRDALVTGDSVDRFRGDEHSAEFTTTCQRPAGWLERCRVTLAIDQQRDSSVLLAEFSTGEQLVLDTRAGSAELRYFDALAVDSAWTKRWAASITMPIAMGVVVATDTAVYGMGPSRE